MERENNTGISRRRFIKTLGATGFAASALANVSLPGWATAAVNSGKMVYRTHPKSGDKVSLLGYGCMRWPLQEHATGQPKPIDQEMVNRLVDHALAEGVNYFDTSPIYLDRRSETVTGIALSRHPRDSYFLATKMSNHHIANAGIKGQAFIDASKEMYQNSFKALRTDYFDYYLMHNIGSGGGWDLFKQRFLDSGILDFLLEERAAGRIRHLGFSFHGDIRTFEYLMEHNDTLKLDFAQIKLNYVDYRHATGWDTNAEYLYEELTKRDIPVIVMEPLMGGKLATLPGNLDERLRQARPGDSQAAWAFRFAGSFPRVLTVLSGMTYMSHLQENLRTYKPLTPCSESEMALLEEVAQAYSKLTGRP